jgi:hypothetical protein
MAFMVPVYEEGEWYDVDTSAGGSVVPADLVGDKPTRERLAQYVEGEVESWERKHAIGARLSAPGYMDATDWTLHETIEEARQYIEDTYEVDPETGDELAE